LQAQAQTNLEQERVLQAQIAAQLDAAKQTEQSIVEQRKTMEAELQAQAQANLEQERVLQAQIATQLEAARQAELATQARIEAELALTQEAQRKQEEQQAALELARVRRETLANAPLEVITEQDLSQQDEHAVEVLPAAHSISVIERGDYLLVPARRRNVFALSGWLAAAALAVVFYMQYDTQEKVSVPAVIPAQAVAQTASEVGVAPVESNAGLKLSTELQSFPAQ
jgi:hypothetical protein